MSESYEWAQDRQYMRDLETVVLELEAIERDYENRVYIPNYQERRKEIWMRMRELLERSPISSQLRASLNGRKKIPS